MSLKSEKQSTSIDNKFERLYVVCWEITWLFIVIVEQCEVITCFILAFIKYPLRKLEND